MDIVCKKCGCIDYVTVQNGQHVQANCANCGTYIKFLPQERTKPVLYFGKYKGREIASMRSEEEIKYLQWFAKLDDLKSNTRQNVINHLKSLNRD
jgi:uncharacterized protein (DUF3820 family)